MTGEDRPTDLLHRPWRDLRISVMDRCNFRCPYCMPASVYHDGFRFLAPEARLGFDQIVRIARSAARLGVRKLRLTGGEPLLRPDLPALVARLVHIPGIDDVALTTNGVLLDRHLAALHDAGLTRLTFSLDSLDRTTFMRMSGGQDLCERVLRNLDAAARMGFPGGIKINTVVQKGVNEDSVIPLVARFRHTGIVPRFIEYMDVGTCNGWKQDAVVPSARLLEEIASRWPLHPLAPSFRGEVAERYRFADGGGEIGFISSVTAPFCGSCSRARLSSDGRLYTCLFATEGHDLRPALAEDDERARKKGVPDGHMQDGPMPEENMPEGQALDRILSDLWQGRRDRYSEERQSRTADAPSERIEMFYIGG
ncbi:GTP 3',8-cyclase MoaA [Swaminathania salitolerans]|uniref:GTP 3',8-cyclase n=1 Tax=Swaminathania salitolerans TaxID=182838 RepID=A0A511BKU2_9PROT|nr:GTP 3',8-cyclase MoaA [Swaminathania salitolerans]GBQ09447.1 molybdenum cofactor biosynthesis protein A [Swaminathania salitolerans LMG 21291]GEL00970.1 GTP 3',8-cyclase [Swaminathania salitolerans]